ncbi:MAG: hypothetical protein M3O30_00775 [Planctomycetota bacterium]|nr:hypothetical protein [Planctomycetota bacterium]
MSLSFHPLDGPLRGLILPFMPNATPIQMLDAETIAILRCPVTGSPLRLEDDHLVSEVGGLRYLVRNGVPVLLAEEARLPAGIESLQAFKTRFASEIKPRFNKP